MVCAVCRALAPGDPYAIVNLARSELLLCGSVRAVPAPPRFLRISGAAVPVAVLGIAEPDVTGPGEQRLPFGLRRILPQALDYVNRARPTPSSTQTARRMNRYIGSMSQMVRVTSCLLQQRHVMSLEARPPSLGGKGEITERDLVRNALRMRPDSAAGASPCGGVAASSPSVVLCSCGPGSRRWVMPARWLRCRVGPHK